VLGFSIGTGQGISAIVFAFLSSSGETLRPLGDISVYTCEWTQILQPVKRVASRGG